MTDISHDANHAHDLGHGHAATGQSLTGHSLTGQSATEKAAERSLEARILITVLLALVGWGLSIWFWGVPGLYVPALALVPVCYVVLIVISRG